MATNRCPACGEAFRLGDRRATTATGRVVHDRCEVGLTAAAAGVLANPASPGGGGA